MTKHIVEQLTKAIKANKKGTYSRILARLGKSYRPRGGK